MKTRIIVDSIMSATPVIGQALVLELDMTESQMYNALNSFLENVTDATWAKWVAQINAEIYGSKDANVTAAAQDLLDALQAVIALEDKVDPEGLFRGLEGIKSRAAIAKATGRKA